MDILLGLLLLAATLAVLAYPLYRSRPSTAGSTGGALNDLLAQRDGLYATLRDLDLDYQLGKLDRGDYASRREKYLALASQVLKQLDLLRANNEAEGNLGDEIEREVAALRRMPLAAPAPKALACPNCGQVYNEGDRFCRRCGRSLP